MNLVINMQAETLLARLAGAGDRLKTGLRSAVTRLAITVQGAVKEGKLTGQVLSVRTGTLRRSINYVVAEDDRSVIATVGTNVRYAHAHEYGFSGAVSVRAHTRTSVLGLAYTVGDYTRQMNLPERSFLRSTLREREPEIRETLRATVLEAVRP